MHMGKIDLDKREWRMYNNLMETTTVNVTTAFNKLCTKILIQRGIENFRPPFEVVVGCGGQSTQLIYWLD